MTSLALRSTFAVRREMRRAVADDVLPDAAAASGRRAGAGVAAARLPSSRDVAALVWNLDGLLPR